MYRSETIPRPGLLDIFTRIDDLLALNLVAIRSLTTALSGRELLAPTFAPTPEITVQPVPVIIKAPLEYEIPIAKPARYSGTDQIYQELTSWAIPSDRASGTLKFVEMWATSASYDYARWKLEACGQVVFNDLQIDAALTLEFGDPRLAPGSSIKLSVKSSDGTSITVNGDITGKEQLK